MDIVLASHNKKKLIEMQSFMTEIAEKNGFEDIKILSLSDIGFEGDIIEDGESFEENAEIKAKTIAKLGYYAIADDSGLMVDYLDGAPGIYSARFAGEICDDKKNNEKLLSLMENVPDEKRNAKYVSVIAFVEPNSNNAKILARGECHGKILREYRGSGGFGYDPLFYYEPYGKTYAEITLDEKARVSHRANAFKKFSEEFVKLLKGEHLC